MESMYYIGLDVHQKTISYCVKDVSGRMHGEGKIPATRFDLDQWMKTLPQPWTVAMEATIFTGWIYDHLRPHAAAVKVAPGPGQKNPDRSESPWGGVEPPLQGGASRSHRPGTERDNRI
jgi:hypothetical protein